MPEAKRGRVSLRASSLTNTGAGAWRFHSFSNVSGLAELAIEAFSSIDKRTLVDRGRDFGAVYARSFAMRPAMDGLARESDEG